MRSIATCLNTQCKSRARGFGALVELPSAADSGRV